MRLHEIITETQDLDEAPNAIRRAAKALGISTKQALGNLSQKTANKVKQSALGAASKVSSRASGKLAASNEADSLTKDFKFYMGSSKQKPTANTLITFLKQEGHPVDRAQQVIDQIPGATENNQLLSANAINKVMKAVANQLVSTGNIQTSNTPTPNKTSTSNTVDTDQIKIKLNRLDKNEKQELINHLKKTDSYNQLNF